MTLSDFDNARRVDILERFEKQLLPCSFCGGEGIFMSCYDDPRDPYIFVECTTCGSHSKALLGFIQLQCINEFLSQNTRRMDATYNCVDELVRLWNMRTGDIKKKKGRMV